MSKQSISLLSLTLIATGVIAAHRFSTFAGTQATAGADVFGVTTCAVANGDHYKLDVIGTTVLETGAAFDAGDYLKSDASGRGIEATTADIAYCRALQASTGAGQFVEVLFLRQAATA